MVVAEASAVTEYDSAGYAATGYGDTSSNVVTDSSVYPTDGTGVYAASADGAYTVPPAPSFADGNIYGTDANSVIQEAHVNATYETKPDVEKGSASENLVATGTALIAASQVAAYDSSVNGSVGGDAGSITSANGTAADIAEGATAATMDGLGMTHSFL